MKHFSENVYCIYCSMVKNGNQKYTIFHGCRCSLATTPWNPVNFTVIFDALSINKKWHLKITTKLNEEFFSSFDIHLCAYGSFCFSIFFLVILIHSFIDSTHQWNKWKSITVIDGYFLFALCWYSEYKTEPEASNC